MTRLLPLAAALALASCQVARLDPSAIYACEADGTCPAGLHCVGGWCLPSCATGADCEPGEVCQANLCVLPVADASVHGADAAGADASGIGIDAAAALDASAAAPDAASPGQDAALAGQDAASAGVDAAAPGQDAATPGEDASLPGKDAASAPPDAAAGLPDAGAPDSGPPPGCTDGATMGCGNCGTATCAGGTWGDCVQATGSCVPGTVQDCGTGTCASQICGPTCGWGPCFAVVGGCTPGEERACGSCQGQLCLEDCSWGPCDRAPPCDVGQIDGCQITEECWDNNCNCGLVACTRSCDGLKRCNSDCSWGACDPVAGGTCNTCDCYQ